VKKLILLLPLFIGCASVSTNLYRGATTYPPTDSQKVSVYHQKPQNVDFIEIGEITVSDVSSWKDVEGALKKEAAKLGGDAVYIIQQNKTTQGGIVPAYGGRYGGGIYGGVGTNLIVTGVVIKYNE
jgi:hypothetical protein